MHDDTVVEIEGVNGEWFTVAGPNAGDRGVYLLPNVTGLFDPPGKVSYEEPGNWPGSRFLSYRIQERHIVLALAVVDDGGDSWSGRDSAVRKALRYDKDAYFHITTPESGHRKLAFRLGGDGTSPALDVDFTVDPHLGSVVVIKCQFISGDPFWYGDDVLYTVKTTKDTRFQPTILGNPAPWSSLPSETLQITVDPKDGKGGLNPTDQDIWLKWAVPGSQEQIPDFPWPFPAGVAIPWDKAPYSQFVIPDFSFEDDANANRRLTTPGLIIGENCVIDTDPREEQFTSASGSQVWARTNGVRFKFPVPSYTKSCTFPIGVTGCAPGQMISLRIPRPWSRPWGLEA